MTENNAAQAAEQAIKAAIRKAYDDGYNDAKMAPDNCSTYCVERAVRLDSAALLSKLRAPVADERAARHAHRILKTEEDHAIAIARISALMDLNPKPGSADDDEMQLLALLIQSYERAKYPLPAADPAYCPRCFSKWERDPIITPGGLMQRCSNNECQHLRWNRPAALASAPVAGERAADDTLKQVYDRFGIGVLARNPSTLMACLGNVIRRANCLSQVEQVLSVPTPPEPEDDGVWGEESLLRWGADEKGYAEHFKAAMAEWSRRAALASAPVAGEAQRPLGYVAVLHAPCGARYFSRITDQHQARVCAEQWAKQYADVKPGPWPTEAVAVYAAPQASEAAHKEAAAIARSFGAPDMADALDPAKRTGLDGEAVRDAALTPLLARALAEWHEDDGPVTWWAWCGHEWAGEAPWCGTPLDQDWPGYHTHWTPIPGVPAALSAQPGAHTTNNDGGK